MVEEGSQQRGRREEREQRKRVVNRIMAQWLCVRAAEKRNEEKMLRGLEKIGKQDREFGV